MRRVVGLITRARWWETSSQRIARLCKHQYSTFSVVNPANGDVVGHVPEDSAKEVREKFDRAAEGQKRWQATPLKQRQAALIKFTELLTADADRLAAIVTSEMGKPISQARNEVRATGQRIKYFVDNAAKVLEPQTVTETAKMTERIVYEPLGVVANISAWNYPYFVSANVFGAALVMGNAVLFKPSEYASLSGLEMTSLLHKAGVPSDVFIATCGRGETGSALASLPGLGGIFFTGSNATGRAVAKSAADNLVKVQLELGGKDPVYVRHDVSSVKGAAAALADGAFYNCGQSCCAVERIYVDKRIYPEFVEEYAKVVKGFKVGDPVQADTFIGPLAQVRQPSVLASQLSDAVEKGASVVVGGAAALEGLHPKGNFFPPTVLTEVTHAMTVMRDESFGPIIGIQAVDGDAEAVELMKDTNYGLTAGVYCKDREDALAILTELDVGSGYWNCCDRSVPRLPWSGRKGSGLGCTLSMEGLRAMVQPKALHLQTP
eukprot:TRINITY_DN1142_c0_g2_i2.p1 TRINITY_DN1142_c0_g2~~TRINITY_DN1142_c0_g2_i2.p1  ORF type:complete len:492 (-),score=77.73 TRINITY_DN1142_c0_g2_i2:389-1864(-)